MNKHKLVIEHPHDNIKQKQSPFIKFKSHFSSHFHSHQSAFTIVELLVVIVVIGILSTIIFVSYSGITKKATATVLQSDLKNASTILEMDKVTNGTYPATLEDANDNLGIKPSSNNSLSYQYNPTLDSYLLYANSNNLSYYTTPNGASVEYDSSLRSTFALNYSGEVDSIYVDIAQDGSDNLWTNGYSYDLNGNISMLTAKHDSAGNLLWNKTWESADGAVGNDIVDTYDGGAMACLDVDVVGDGDIAVVKYDTNGNVVWSKTWGGSLLDTTGGAGSCVQTSDNGLVMTGFMSSFGAGGREMFIVKFSANGDLVWNKTWGRAVGDWGYNITETNNGDLVVVGMLTDTYGSGKRDVLVARFNANGDLIWNKAYGGTNEDKGYCIVEMNDGSLVFAGDTNSFGSGNYDLIISKITSTGDLVWARTLGGPDYDYVDDVTITNDGGVVVLGYSADYPILIAKFSTDGDLVWGKSFDYDYAYAYSMIESVDGGLLIGGGNYDSDKKISSPLIIKYDSNGNLLGCPESICKTANLTITTPAIMITTPNATMTSPLANITNPTPTINTPVTTLVEIIRFAPPF